MKSRACPKCGQEMWRSWNEKLIPARPMWCCSTYECHCNWTDETFEDFYDEHIRGTCQICNHYIIGDDMVVQHPEDKDFLGDSVHLWCDYYYLKNIMDRYRLRPDERNIFTKAVNDSKAG